MSESSIEQYSFRLSFPLEEFMSVLPVVETHMHFRITL